MIYNDILELVGKTPMVKLNRYMKKYNLSGNIIAKLENTNPMNSVKDRVALQMVLDAEEDGRINSSTTLIEATSGNTGIGLALVAAIKGYKLIITMPETMSIERVQILKAFGAEVVLTPGSEGMKGSIRRAEELNSEIANSVVMSQFTNQSVVKVHRINTGKEILNDLNGDVNILVAGVGTGGTITGTSQVLKEHNHDIKTIAVEPAGSPMISKGEKGPHKIPGIGAGFIPEVLDVNIIDEVITVSDADAAATAKELLVSEGLYVGVSAGAAVYAARQAAARKENTGKNIVVILPDSGYRYMSNNIFE
ncbi:MAG: cysteine synthase A [Clostridia bacterium]|nr:cysteine synthase A [Clostridia bacterium]